MIFRPTPSAQELPSTATARVLRATGARALGSQQLVQSLWSGYGRILRVELIGARVPSVVVKWVEPPSRHNHPRGWHTDHSHERKLRSYHVERCFYAHVAPRLSPACRVPQARLLEETEQGWFFILEDLDAAGFSERVRSPHQEQIRACLNWLARFHAETVSDTGTPPPSTWDASALGLWPEGTYWHLATRPDELAAMRNQRLRAAARELDGRLAANRFRCLVHGDAKLANFCFRPDGAHVAAVDFQYVGGGCGMKDVAYLLSSCLEERELERLAPALLDHYFALLGRRLEELAAPVPFEELERSWRGLYAFAWADFVRFLDGWAPDHFKLHGYSRAQTELALADLASDQAGSDDESGRPGES